MPIINFSDYFPNRTGQSGKFLTTDGSAISWASISVNGVVDFPTQATHSGKLLTTNGTTLSWTTLSSANLSDSALIPLENTANAFTAQQYFSEATLVDAATISWPVSGAQVAKVTLGGNRIMAAPTGLQNGAFYALMVIQDGSGSKTISWNSVFKWSSGVAPTLTTTANGRDLFVFRSDGTSLYEVGRSLSVG